ncbi:MAG: SAM-dependent methyltransferase [Verrucomicrobia bacterium]|nr:SAM-dependent methyltransferase [Verrucomicrobiota bacterium]
MPSPVAQIIRDEVTRRGLIPFAEFMSLALYHPEHGYYVRPEVRIGRAGDFFTNVSVGAVYGQILADQVAAMHRILGMPEQFTILEQGTEDGRLARDILERLNEAAPRTYAATTYLLIEPHASLRSVQQDQLAAFRPKVAWADAPAEVRPFTGVVLAHELLDAFPVHLVEWRAGAWQELGVTLEGNRLAYAPLPELAPELAAQLQCIPAPPPDAPPYRTEVNLAALGWIRSISRILTRGFVLIIDYGYPRQAYYAPHRSQGTLSCYRRHRRDHDPLGAPGEKDITAHVDFTSLAETGARCGLEVAGFTDQHHFIVGAAERRLSELAPGTTSGRAQPKSLRGLQTLLHPAHLGTVFRYLVFTRPRLPLPDGFRYGRDPRRELGLEEGACPCRTGTMTALEP